MFSINHGLHGESQVLNTSVQLGVTLSTVAFRILLASANLQGLLATPPIAISWGTGRAVQTLSDRWGSIRSGRQG